MLEKDWLGITTISREAFISNINIMLEGVLPDSPWKLPGQQAEGSQEPALSNGAELGLSG